MNVSVGKLMEIVGAQTVRIALLEEELAARPQPEQERTPLTDKTRDEMEDVLSTVAV